MLKASYILSEKKIFITFFCDVKKKIVKPYATYDWEKLYLIKIKVFLETYLTYLTKMSNVLLSFFARISICLFQERFY